jgi:hypothetical protein
MSDFDKVIVDGQKECWGCGFAQCLGPKCDLFRAESAAFRNGEETMQNRAIAMIETTGHMLNLQRKDVEILVKGIRLLSFEKYK